MLTIQKQLYVYVMCVYIYIYMEVVFVGSIWHNTDRTEHCTHLHCCFLCKQSVWVVFQQYSYGQGVAGHDAKLMRWCSDAPHCATSFPFPLFSCLTGCSAFGRARDSTFGESAAAEECKQRAARQAHLLDTGRPLYAVYGKSWQRMDYSNALLCWHAN